MDKENKNNNDKVEMTEKAVIAVNTGSLPKPDQQSDNPSGDVTGDTGFVWNCDEDPGVQTDELSKRMADTGELYRTTDGSLMWIPRGDKPRVVSSTTLLEGFIRKHLSVKVTRNGKPKGYSIPAKDLSIFLKTPELQTHIPVVDHITDVVTYTSEWEMIQPGYNAGKAGERFYYTGIAVKPASEPRCIKEFLAALSFKEKRADAANTVALALTVLLRHRFPGGKPFAVVTANRSHAGKDTVLDFAAGRTLRTEISWNKADWALQNEAVAALGDPRVGVLTMGNVRTSGIIESPFIERLVTAPDAVLQSSRRGAASYSRKGDFVVGCSSNHGRFSTDLINRSLPISLELLGSLEDRPTPLGDLRNEYLPAHRDEIEAELCGMIEKWKAEGNPLDEKAKHPMREWASTIGGILNANGFDGFLANWTLACSIRDRATEALGILAHAMQPVQGKDGADGWLRLNRIVETAVTEGVITDLIEVKSGMKSSAMERNLGIILSGHKDNTVAYVDDNDDVKRYRIDRMKRRINGANPATCYKFDPVKISDSVQEEGGDDNKQE